MPEPELAITLPLDTVHRLLVMAMRLDLLRVKLEDDDLIA